MIGLADGLTVPFALTAVSVSLNQSDFPRVCCLTTGVEFRRVYRLSVVHILSLRQVWQNLFQELSVWVSVSFFFWIRYQTAIPLTQPAQIFTGGFLAAQAEREQFLYLTKMTELRIKSSCSSQLRREVFETLSTVGLDAVRIQMSRLASKPTAANAEINSVNKSVSAAVADSLYRVEMETSKKSLGEGSEYNTMMERKPQAGALSKYFMGRVGDRPGLTNL